MTENLRDVFNQIAPSWYNYRHRTIFRRELEALAAEWQNGRLLNIGCGHGADFVPFAGKFELHGIDFSGEMLRLARKYAEKYDFNPNPVKADATSLPYIDGVFTHAIAVATYHHLKREQRLPAMLELKRVLKPGGTAFITVWNRWQPRFWLHRSDTDVAWRMKEKTVYRYYHLFTCGELARLVKKAGLSVEKIFPESVYRFPMKLFSQNICLLVKKTEKDA